jgi:hypothetical protein
MAEIVFKPAWRKDDPELERDAIAFWRRMKILPPNVRPEDRAKELCAVIYKDGEAVGVSTITLDYMKQFRGRLAMWRISIAPFFRRRDLATELGIFTRDVMEQWSLENPAEGVMGVGAVIQARQLIQQRPSVYWPGGMMFMGYMPSGHPLRVCWFKHAVVSTEWPPVPDRALAPGRAPGGER